MIPTEWGRGGGERPPEWQKTPWGGATEWAGGSSRLRAPTPPEWLRGPGGTKPQEGPQRLRADRGRTDGGGGEGTKTTHLLSNQDTGNLQWRRQADGQTADGRAAQHDGDSGERLQRGAPATAI